MTDDVAIFHYNHPHQWVWTDPTFTLGGERMDQIKIMQIGRRAIHTILHRCRIPCHALGFATGIVNWWHTLRSVSETSDESC